ncbi:hypothetical protein H0H92_011409 [Tricholoma furcatifolium]|nr:hypothetical protein H0H92_011409 [Tricholoma furcatifolium]
MPFPTADHLSERLALPPWSPGSPYDAGFDSPWETGVRSGRPSSYSSSRSSPHWPGIRPASLSSGATSYSIGSRSTIIDAPSEAHPGRSSRSVDNELLIHPLLDAEAPHPELHFDLSCATCEPLLARGNGESMMAISPQELSEPLTHPPITRLRIVSDRLPENWAIEIDHMRADNAYMSGGRTMTVNDVMQVLHRELHLQISASDFEKLSLVGQGMVQRAFTQRCRPVPQGSTRNSNTRELGAKRVDYLGRDTKVVGLLREPRHEGWDVMRLVTKE